MQLRALIRRWVEWRTLPQVATRTPGEGDVSIRELLRAAIQQKQQVFAFRKGRLITFCPHAMASGPDGLYVLAFMIAGDVHVPDDSFSSPKRWRWIALADLKTVMRRPGEWFSAPKESRPLLRSLSIELEAV